MKPTPDGWPRLSLSIFYQNPIAAIDWLCRAFGFEVRLKIEDGQGGIIHSELTYGGAVLMVYGEKPGENPERPWQPFLRSPATISGTNTQTPCLYVDDVDTHCEAAREAGARILREPQTDDYGPEYWSDRNYGCLDPEGHIWWFMQRIHTAGQKTAPIAS